MKNILKVDYGKVMHCIQALEIGNKDFGVRD